MVRAESRNKDIGEPKTRHSSPAANHSIKSYRDLIVWQKSMDLVEMVYQVTKGFPREELYGLTNQLRRAAVSIPSNIAEGQARNSTAEFRNFLSIARGSLAEVETQLLIAERLNYLGSEKLHEILAVQIEVNKMTNALMKKLVPNHSPLATLTGGQ
ncbi:MAG: four helix bundle protein [Syntrophales bacterium]